LGNNQDNSQLHRFTKRENAAKSFRGGATFLTRIVYTTALKDIIKSMKLTKPRCNLHFVKLVSSE